MSALVKQETGAGTFPLSLWGSFWNDFYDPFALWGTDVMRFYMPPAVNIKETDDNYELDVAVPGMSKTDFKVRVDAHTLSISAETKQEKTENNERYRRHEFAFNSFTRTFTLPDHVDKENVTCKYDNGLLHIELPKAEHAKTENGQRDVKVT